MRHEEGFLTAKDHLRLFWQSTFPETAKAHVALLHGYGDHSGRYKTTIDALTGAGFAVHAFDYRGHGQSDGRRGYCDRFGDYLDDLETFLSRVRPLLGGKKLFIVAHSNGALISLLYSIQRSPAGLAGLVTSSAYLRLALKPPALKVLGARLMGQVIPWLPVKTEIAIGQLTHDAEVQRATELDPLYLRVVTPRWFSESSAAQAEVLKRAPELRLPCLLLHGGADPIADQSASRELYERAGSSDKNLKVYDGFFHEILNEVGRERVEADVVHWLAERA